MPGAEQGGRGFEPQPVRQGRTAAATTAAGSSPGPAAAAASAGRQRALGLGQGGGETAGAGLCEVTAVSGKATFLDFAPLVGRRRASAVAMSLGSHSPCTPESGF